jgi:predicted adenylyl cyclase CyaB
MPRNVEIKAKIDKIESFAQQISIFATSGPFKLFQHDTFFNCPHGNLKLRSFSESEGELIFYKRPLSNTPKLSVYQLSPTYQPETLRTILTAAYGVLGSVRKQRFLYLIENTRIHLDRVEGLGDFLEIEVVLDDHQSESYGESIALELMAKIGLSNAQLLPASYLEMLQNPNRYI